MRLDVFQENLGKVSRLKFNGEEHFLSFFVCVRHVLNVFFYEK